MTRYSLPLLFLLLALAAPLGVADADLPLLGEDSSQLLKQEEALGRDLYRQLLDRGLVIDDPLLADYLSDIGHALLGALDRRLRDYRFFIVADESVNAFAAPGGYIGVHIGMIEQVDSEDELAAVLAHEIQHVRLRHGMQMVEKMGQIRWLGLLGVLNALLLATKDPEAAAAMIALSQAGSAQSAINFTRENEYEADRLGLELLQASDYDPWAMADLMMLLQRKERSGTLAQIEYLRTHPVNANRIAEVRARLPEGRKTRRQSRFFQFRDYLLHLYPLRATRRKGSRFAQALSMMQQGEYERAGRLLDRLIGTDPDSIWYRSAAAENLLRQQRPAEAAAAYRALLELYPGHVGISLRLSEVLLQQGETDAAARLLEGLRQERRVDLRLYTLLTRLYRQQGRTLQMSLAQADYHWLKGNRQLAARQYRRLLADAALSLAEREKIEQKLAVFEAGE